MFRDLVLNFVLYFYYLLLRLRLFSSVLIFSSSPNCNLLWVLMLAMRDRSSLSTWAFASTIPNSLHCDKQNPLKEDFLVDQWVKANSKKVTPFLKASRSLYHLSLSLSLSRSTLIFDKFIIQRIVKMEENKPMPNTPKLTQVQSNNSTANHMSYLPSQFDSPHQGNLMGSCDGSCAALQRRQDRPILYDNSSLSRLYS